MRLVCILLAGSISAAIASYVRQKDYDIIFIGHDSDDSKLNCIMGSITNGLLVLAHCPVTVVRE